MKLFRLNLQAPVLFILVVLFVLIVSPVLAGDAEDVLALVNAHRQANGVARYA